MFAAWLISRHMRFDEPELMIDAARYSGEEIGRVGVARISDCPIASRADCPNAARRSDREYVLVFVSDAQRIGDEEGALGRDLDGALHAAETGGALGDQVGIAGRLAGTLSNNSWTPMKTFQCVSWPCRSIAAPSAEFDGLRAMFSAVLWVGCMVGLRGFHKTWVAASRRSRAVQRGRVT
jgi:hypothetical protein